MQSMVLLQNDLAATLDVTADVTPNLSNSYWGLVERSAAAESMRRKSRGACSHSLANGKPEQTTGRLPAQWRRTV